jgi:hypothetical protein
MFVERSKYEAIIRDNERMETRLRAIKPPILEFEVIDSRGVRTIVNGDTIEKYTDSTLLIINKDGEQVAKFPHYISVKQK